ncbi:MAG TPA: hypothetical protein EYG91_02440 [Aquifex aeolicus]|nr:hypothetical protein [Aquifex aeolicus]
MGAKEVICQLKGQFFLSPREEKFLKYLKEELNLPDSVIEEGIKECLKSVNPYLRKNYPIFRCLSKILEIHKLRSTAKARNNHLDWKRVFEKKIDAVKHLLDVQEFKIPKSEEEAEETLRSLEKELFKKLWKELNDVEKKKIIAKYKEVKKENEELFKELVKYELRIIYEVPYLSLYVD